METEYVLSTELNKVNWNSPLHQTKHLQQSLQKCSVTTQKV